MLTDRYDNPLGTGSPAARDAYVRGLDLFIGGDAGAESALMAALEADQGFALAHLALARVRQVAGRAGEVGAPLAKAQALSGGVSSQEASAIAALAPMLEGRGAEAYPAIRAHVARYPRDVLLAQTCMGVFGLIGFSGQPGREAEQLAYAASLAPHYGEDWWFLALFAFAQLEAGQLDPARRSIQRSLELNPSPAHSAHVYAHLLYECGETEAGLAYLGPYQAVLDREATMHCHISWHVGLWALETGDLETMWAVLDRDVGADVSRGPPLNTMTDMAALLARAEMKGVDVPPDYWRRVSAFAAERFAQPGLAFADVHAALAHAMAGESDALQRILREAKGPAGDMVQALAGGFAGFAAGDWNGAIARFEPAMADHARIGGSRAQRDLVELAMSCALLRAGHGDEAARMLRMRRPLTVGASA